MPDPLKLTTLLTTNLYSDISLNSQWHDEFPRKGLKTPPRDSYFAQAYGGTISGVTTPSTCTPPPSNPPSPTRGCGGQ